MLEKIRVIIFQEENRWVAQALEHDICASADTVEDLELVFGLTISLESDELGGVERIPQAPGSFFKMWDDANGSTSSKMSDDGMIEMKLAA